MIYLTILFNKIVYKYKVCDIMNMFSMIFPFKLLFKHVIEILKSNVLKG